MLCRHFEVLASSRSHLALAQKTNIVLHRSTNVNVALLHPHYHDESTDTSTEIDPKIREYKEKKDFARRSPFPTIVCEVRSTPTPDERPRR